MYLINVFLPLADNNGKRFHRDAYAAVENELTERFGGVTAYPRAPASGLWKTDDSKTQEDDLIIYEVMAKELDRNWWSNYRHELEDVFRQEKLVMRSQKVELL
jgi:hypothetical protein